MAAFFTYIKQYHFRTIQYFTKLEEEIAQDNLLTLRSASIGFEIFLAIYGIWAFFAFQNLALNIFYLFYLLPNTFLMTTSLKIKRSGQITAKKIQRCCVLYIIEVMSFIIGISIFPFPDRPAIFYSLAYTIMILLFQFTFLQMTALLTLISGLFILLVVCFKDPVSISYDLVSCITTWMLNIFILYAVSNLRLRNGEIRLELKHQSHTDYLSGLLNRREMDNVFSRLYKRCAVRQENLAVIMLDIDKFKQFNDKFGHSAGDNCIKYIGIELKDFVNETGFFAARYGGEEFALMLPSCDSVEAEYHANTLLNALRFDDPDGNEVTVSIGVATEIPAIDGSLDDLFNRADKALYQAKTEGRNRCVIADHFADDFFEEN